jgi:hypothetical protein
MMSAVQRAIVGIGPLCAYLNETGRKARIVDGAPELSASIRGGDNHVIALEGSPIDLLTVRMQGWINERASASAHRVHTAPERETRD